MANNQLAMYTPEVLEAFKPEVLQVIRTSIAPTATDTEFLLFAHKAAAYNLDPFKNEIFFIKYGNTARIQFAAEAYLSKAREQEGFQPPDTQMVHENDTFKIARNKESKELEVVEHEIGFPRGKIIGAYCIAYRDGHRPVTVIADREDIAHMFIGQNKENWNKWTADMFGKFVQQRALKKQYGLEFGDEDIPETPASNNIPEYKPQERKDITPNADVIDMPNNQKQPEPEVSELDKAKADMKEKFKRLGITKTKDMQAYIKEHAPDMSATPTLAEIIGFNQLLDMHIDFKEMDVDGDTPLD